MGPPQRNADAHFYINQVLQFLVLLMSMVIIYLTLFKWKRRDLFIQSTIWLFFTGMVLRIYEDLHTQITGNHTKADIMIDEFGTDLIFAGHLILVLQYLYTSIIMPKILLESELKLDLQTEQQETVASEDVERTASQAFELHLQYIKVFRKTRLVAIHIFGSILWTLITCLDLYFAAHNYEERRQRKILKYSFGTLESSIILTIFSIALYRLYRIVKETKLANINMKMLFVHLIILLLMFSISVISLIVMLEIANRAQDKDRRNKIIHFMDDVQVILIGSVLLIIYLIARPPKKQQQQECGTANASHRLIPLFAQRQEQCLSRYLESMAKQDSKQKVQA